MRAVEELVESRNGQRLNLDTHPIHRYDSEVLARGKLEIEASAKQAYATTHWDVYMDSPVVKHGHYAIQ